MHARRTGRAGVPVLLAALPLVLLGLPACAARGAPSNPSPRAAAHPRAIESVEALPVPGVADWVYHDAVVFTRRLPPTGEAVAFAFTPRELTTAGRLVGELSYTGRHASGRVDGVVARLSFAAAGAAGGCGAVALQLEPVTLDRLGVRAAFPPVSVDLTRAAGPVGRIGAALCQGADRLAAALRELGAALRALGDALEKP